MAAAQIKSPHVAQVFDHGITTEGEPYIVMELLEGEDLRARLKRTGPLPPAEFAPILTQVAKALTRAHQVGIVHRDIKPDNVFLANMGDDILVKVLDFGIAKLTDDAAWAPPSTGSMLGTPFYMSPEQLLSSRSVDFRSDLWSLGVVTYLALTGATALPRRDGRGHLGRRQRRRLPPPERRRGPGSRRPSTRGWSGRCNASPASRFGSAREMAEAFERAVHDASASAEMRAGRDAPWSRPRPKVTTTAPTLAGDDQPQRRRCGAGAAPVLVGLAAARRSPPPAAAMLVRATTRRGLQPAVASGRRRGVTPRRRARTAVAARGAYRRAFRGGPCPESAAAAAAPSSWTIAGQRSAPSPPSRAHEGASARLLREGRRDGEAHGQPRPPPPPPRRHKDTIGF